MVTMERLQETSTALLNGTIADPLRPPLHPKWDPGWIQGKKIRDACATWRIR